MQLRYIPWAIAGGACATLVPGSPLWLAPLAGAMLHMVYDADPDGWQEQGQRLLTSAQRLQLPSFSRATEEETEEAPIQVQPKAKRQATPNVAPDAFSNALEQVQQPTKARDPLLTTLEQEPHRLIIGRSRGGKTTLIHEMATHWADEGARVVVCDPDAMPGLWPGCTVVGHGNDTAKIGRVLKATAQEFERREALWGQGQREFQPIHLVIDEAHEVLPVIDGALETFEDLTRRGAKRAIHLTIGVQDKQVGTLGLKGKSELLKNFIVADVLRDAQGQRKAVIQDAVTNKKTAWTIPQMRDPMSLVTQHAARVAPKPAPAALGETERLPKEDSLLAGLLASEPPKQETATASVVHDGHTINVYASATAEPGTKQPARPRGATGTNMRRRVAAIKGSRKAKTLDEVYAELAHLKFEDAYAVAGGGDRNKAHAAWKKAKDTVKSTTKP